MKTFYIGIDLGGTNIKAALVSKTGQLSHSLSHPTQARSGKLKIIANTLDLVEQLLAQPGKCLGIGLSWPSTSNQPLSNVEIKKILRKKYSLPVVYENDANLFTLGEAVYGQGKKYSTVVCLTLGTGLGCGVVDKGQLYVGRSGVSEIGHTIIYFDGHKCVCGSRRI